jgi:hypothetical protein
MLLKEDFEGASFAFICCGVCLRDSCPSYCPAVK